MQMSALSVRDTTLQNSEKFRVLYCMFGEVKCHTAVFNDVTVPYYSVQCRHIGSATLRLAQYSILHHTAVFSDITVPYNSVQCRHRGSATL